LGQLAFLDAFLDWDIISVDIDCIILLLSVKIGKKHPDPVVETASLSSVEPNDVWYKLHIPDECIRKGALSALQLESIVYSCQQHNHILPDGRFFEQ